MECVATFATVLVAGLGLYKSRSQDALNQIVFAWIVVARIGIFQQIEGCARYCQ